LRLGTKIIIGFICISLLLVCIGLISDNFTSDIRQEQMRYVNEASEVVIYTGEMERSLFQSLIYLNTVREAIPAESEYSNIQEYPSVVEMVNRFENELAQFEASFANLEKVLGRNSEIPDDLGELLNSYQVYRSIAREWLNLSNVDMDQIDLMFINSIEPYFRNNIIPEINQVRTFVLSIQQDRNVVLNNSLRQAANVNYFATFFSVLMAIALAIYIYRSIANPLSKMSRTAKKIGDGNLDERIHISSKDELGELTDAFNAMVSSLQKSTVSKAYLDNIIESIQEALFVTDKDGNLIRVNSAASRMVGYEIDEMINEPIDKFYNFKKMRQEYEKYHEKDFSFEFSLIHKNKSFVPVLFSEAKLMDNHGQYVGQVSVASDISDRKQAEEELKESLKEKEVMLAEIHHRVKNNLAVISGLLQLQGFSAKNEDVKKALSDSQMRIQSIALVHEMLYESESLAFIDYDHYINDLLQAISSMHLSASKEIKLTSDLEPVSLSVNQAIPCSLLVNELIVNAFKHAFPENQKGEIKVTLRQNGEKVILRISDNGTGFSKEKFNASGSLGATLIKALTSQLKGDFEILESSASNGSVFKIEFKRESQI